MKWIKRVYWLIKYRYEMSDVFIAWVLSPPITFKKWVGALCFLLGVFGYIAISIIYYIVNYGLED